MAKELTITFSIIVGDQLDYDQWVTQALNYLDAVGALAQGRTEVTELAEDEVIARYGRRL